MGYLRSVHHQNRSVGRRHAGAMQLALTYYLQTVKG